MDPADLNNLIEKAKSNAAASGAKKKEDKEKEKEKEKGTAEGEQETTNAQSAPGLANEGVKVAELDQLLARIEVLTETEELDEELRKRAAARRAGHIKIAKLLLTADVFSGVSR